MSLILTDNSPLLKFLFSASSNFFCLLTSASNLSSNSATISFIFSKSSSFSQLSCSTMNFFCHIKYFTTLLTFLLFNIFSTSHSLTSSTSTSFTFSTFCFLICSLYLSGAVHTGGESLQYGPRDIWTCWITLASAYVLCHLSAIWSQLQMIGRSLRWEWVLIWCIAVEYWRLSSIRVYLH